MNHLLGDIVIVIIIIFLLFPVTHLLSPLPPPSTNSYPHRSELKFQTAALSVLCVMFQVQLSFVLNLFLALPSIGQTAVVSAPNVNRNRIKLN
jgi:hypothetical protein